MSDVNGFSSGINTAIDSSSQAKYTYSKLWSEFLQEFYDIAISIEVGERKENEAAAIVRSLDHIKLLSEKFQAIEDYLKPFRDVVKSAIEEKLNA